MRGTYEEVPAYTVDGEHGTGLRSYAVHCGEVRTEPAGTRACNSNRVGVDREVEWAMRATESFFFLPYSSTRTTLVFSKPIRHQERQEIRDVPHDIVARRGREELVVWRDKHTARSGYAF